MAKMSEKKKAALEKEQHETAEKVEKEFPVHPADQYILQRFVFEPRCEFQGNRKWLVIKDRVTGKYLREDDNPRVYRIFRDSWDCIEYLRSKFVAPEPAVVEAEPEPEVKPDDSKADPDEIIADHLAREQMAEEVLKKIKAKAKAIGLSEDELQMVDKALYDPLQEFCQREGNFRLIEMLDLDVENANSLTDEAAEVVRDTIDYNEELYDSLDKNLQSMLDDKLGGSAKGE